MQKCSDVKESVGAVLDYTSLLQNAYIVNPQWTDLAENTSLSFEFRGNTYNETYNPQRHFSSFSAAYSYFESLYTESDGSLNSQVAEKVPRLYTGARHLHRSKAYGTL